MAVLVFGGSGQIGQFLLPRLRERGETVVAISRHPPGSSRDGITWMQGALPEAVPPYPPMQAILSAGPLDAFAQWLQAAPMLPPRIVAIGSMSAVSKADAAQAADRTVAARLAAAEQGLAEACARHGSAWTVLRPTLVYGAGRDRSITPIAQRALRTRLFPLPAGNGLRQPVHADDIAHSMLAALDTPGSAERIFELGGGERLTARAMFARVRGGLPVATLPLPLPRWSLRLAQAMLPALRGPLGRLDQDLIADNTPLNDILGIHPRPFRPTWRQAKR